MTSKFLSYVSKITITLFIILPMYIFSFLFPRKKKRWVFSGKNFSDNSKYLFIKLSNNYPEITTIWVSNSIETVEKIRRLGFIAHYQNSIKGYYYMLSANVHIISHFMGTPYWTIGRAKLINLWHGVGIKNILFNSNIESTRKIYHHPLYKLLYRPFLILEYRKADLLIATSIEISLFFKKCFRVKKDAIINSYYPRCEIFKLDKESLMMHIKKYEDEYFLSIIKKIKKYKKTFIYMPTWRVKRPNYLTEANIDFEILNNKMLKEDSVFLFKLHPLTSNQEIKEINKYSNLLLLDTNLDVYPLLPFTDCLITDYSSIYYDYLLLKNKSTIFFLFDYLDYINNNQDLTMNFDDATVGPKVYNFSELLDILQSKLPIDIDSQKRQKIFKLFWGKDVDKKDIITTIKKLDN